MYFLVKLYHNDIEDLCNNVYGVRMDITMYPAILSLCRPYITMGDVEKELLGRFVMSMSNLQRNRQKECVIIATRTL
jgi:hypothetical protein